MLLVNLHIVFNSQTVRSTRLMATVTHHIRSDYDLEEDRKRLELETGQLDVDAVEEANLAGATEKEEDPWLTEKPFGFSARVLRPPKFVPATIDYNEWGSESRLYEREEKTSQEEKEGIAEWYRSLARKTPSGTPRSSTPFSASATPMKESEVPKSKNTIRRDRNTWFISRALEASTSVSPSTSAEQSPSTSSVPTPAPTPTLADILARDPPPLPSEQKYTPPVWLAIGPSNKGFEMLQKSGWEEGEALGRASRNRSGLGYKEKEKGRDLEDVEGIKQEVVDLTLADKEVVDLTLSDDDDDGFADSREAFAPPSSSLHSRSRSPPRQTAESTTATDLDHAPRALLTPLPTVLKSDRLGIGLKAKMTGSGIYRSPVKRITHSQAALEAHIRASERQKRIKEVVGRGRRGFERIKKKEEEGRKALLAYLNT